MLAGRRLRRLMRETIRAIMKEFVTAISARSMMEGWLKTCWRVSPFVKMPIMGGSRIRARKTSIAARYMAYFRAFFDDNAFRTSLILRLYSKSPLQFYLQLLFFCGINVSLQSPEPSSLSIRPF